MDNATVFEELQGVLFPSAWWGLMQLLTCPSLLTFISISPQSLNMRNKMPKLQRIRRWNRAEESTGP